jgi:ATP-dependent RNA helicase DDX1
LSDVGKWYFEFELLNDNLYQVGWVNDLYVSNPAEGKGVGDCRHSWAVDLYRNAKWHEQEDGMTNRLPYGTQTKWTTGGVLGCYLDLNKMEMSFSYDGNHLGVAFDDFHIGRGLRPGFSTHLQQEAKFNFGAAPFRYSPPPDFIPLVVSVFS